MYLNFSVLLFYLSYVVCRRLLWQLRQSKRAGLGFRVWALMNNIIVLKPAAAKMTTVPRLLLRGGDAGQSSSYLIELLRMRLNQVTINTVWSCRSPVGSKNSDGAP